MREVASSFVGREHDLAAIARRFEEGRLVTITAPGGMGKTRLALRYAATRVSSFTSHGGGGVWFCDLADAHDAAELVRTVAGALGAKLVGIGSDQASAEAVGRAIAQRGRVLLVLDNFEGLTKHARTTVGLWMGVAPSASFLVTSRVPLDLVGEQLWSLSPLSRDEATALFIGRASDVQPSFDAAREQAVVADIVDMIDRMPLAIELAATRMSVVSTSQLRARLERPLEVLARRTELGRHASMRATILDSVELLSEEQRRLFVACTVLRNGFTLESAEAILGDVVVPRAAVLDGLSSLASSSLLRVSLGEGDPVARYGFYETIREVAEELSQSDPSRETLRGRHASHYAALPARLGNGAIPGRGGDASALGLELENLLEAQKTAVSAALATHDAARAREAVSIALGLEPLLSARGLSRLRAHLFGEALGALDHAFASDAVARARALLGRGFAHRELGETRLARGDFELALELARSAREAGLSAVALARLGEMSDIEGDTAGARARFDEALELLDASPQDDDRALREADVHLRIGHALRRENALGEARASIVRAVDRYRAVRNDEGLASALYERAVIDMLREDHDEAFAGFDEGLRVARRSDVRLAIGALTTARGCLLQDLGRLEEALAHHAEGARIFHEAGSRYREASALYYLATTHFECGNPAEAASIVGRAIERLEGVGARRYEALTQGCLAIALAALGRHRSSEDAMARAEVASASVLNEAALASNVAIHRLSLGLSRGEAHDADEVVRRAEALVRAASSDDSRFAFRALSAIAKNQRNETRALVVGEGGRSFRLPGSTEVVGLPERSPLRRILDHLAKRRIDAPGEPILLDDVIRAGWPEERIGAIAAQNRAYVALATLRKKGLRGVLLQSGGGYLITPAVVVRFEI